MKEGKMKKIIATIILSLITIPSHANDAGAWVKVDANGTAIGQAIVCTPAVCGDPNSDHSKLTLKPGEKYVLQSVADANGNVAGIGAGQRPNTEVKVNLETKEWTATTTIVTPVEPEITTKTTEEKPRKIKVQVETTLVEKINNNATMEPVSQTAKVETKIVETPPTTETQQVLDDWYAEFVKEWQALFDALAFLFQGWQMIW